MADRDLPASLETATLAAALMPVFLVRAEFDSGEVRLWDGLGILDWNGADYTGGGVLLGLSVVDETADLRATGWQASLTGIPSSLISLALTEHYQGRPATLYMGALDITTGVLVSDPVRLTGGRMDVMEIEDTGDTCRIALSVEGALADLERPRERLFTHEEQQDLFPGDLGFEFVTAIQNTGITWR